MAGPTLSQVRCLPPLAKKQDYCMQPAWHRIWHAHWRGLIRLHRCQATPGDGPSLTTCALARKQRSRPRAGLLGAPGLAGAGLRQAPAERRGRAPGGRVLRVHAAGAARARGARARCASARPPRQPPRQQRAPRRPVGAPSLRVEGFSCSAGARARCASARPPRQPPRQQRAPRRPVRDPPQGFRDQSPAPAVAPQQRAPRRPVGAPPQGV